MTYAPRILVVDDDLDILELIRGVLEDEGLLVDVAWDGRQALELARTYAPDLIVLDVTLPVVGSSHVAGQLRTAHGESLPVLVITADGHAAQKANALGAYGYLRKPFDISHLVAAVRTGLSQREP